MYLFYFTCFVYSHHWTLLGTPSLKHLLMEETISHFYVSILSHVATLLASFSFFFLFYLTHILCVSGFGFTIAITLKYPIHFHNFKYKVYLSELKTCILVIHIEHPPHVAIFFINPFYLSNKSWKINMYSLHSYSLATHFPSSWAILINKLPFSSPQILLTTSVTSGSLSVWSVSFTPVHSLFHFSRLWH